MRHPTIPSPVAELRVLTVVGAELQVLTVADAVAQFGAGSQLAMAARHLIEGPRVYPPPTPEQIAEREWAELSYRLVCAFDMVGRCVELVEAHASALFDADGETGIRLDVWRRIAFRALALVHDRSPELLPFGHVETDEEDK